MSMIGVDYGVLNQKGSPSWFSDIYANIPTAGYKGRMFISIDTYAFYRDTGTGWDLIGGPGTGTITGSGTSGQVSYFNGSSTLAGSNNLFWDNTNGRLGIGTATPGASLDIHSTGTNAQFNGTGTNNAYLVFQNAGVSKWRIGNNYNGSANTFQIYNNSSSLINLEMTASGNTYFYGTASFNVYGPIIAHSNSVIEDNINYAAGSGYTTFATTNSGSVNSLKTIFGSGFYSQFLFTNTANYQYTFPATTGTLALTSNLSSYLPLAGGIMTGSILLNNNLAISGQLFGTSSYASMISMSPSNKIVIDSNSQGVLFGGTIGQGAYTYTLPSATGTLALTSQIPTGFIPYTGANSNVDLGVYTLTAASLIITGGNGTGGNLTFGQSNAFSIPNANFSAIDAITTSFAFAITAADSTYKYFKFETTGLTNNTLRSYIMPDANGTFALTSDITSAISGTTNTLAKFTSSNAIGNSMLSDDGTTLTSTGATRSNLYIKAANNSYYGQIAFTNGTNGLSGGISYNNSSQYMQFETNTSEWMRLGSNGNLLIGTTTDAGYKLYVNGTIGTNSNLTIDATNNAIINLNRSTTSQYGFNRFGTAGTYYWRVGLESDSTNDYVWADEGNNSKMRLNTNGNLIIGSTTDQGSKAQVYGSFASLGAGAITLVQARDLTTLYGWYADGSTYLNFYNTLGGNVTGQFTRATGVYTPLSDVNKKKDFELSTIGLEAILGLKPTLYRMKEDSNESVKHLGFIAQEVKEFIPQSYVEDKNFIGLQDRPIIAALVKAVQELNQKLVRNNIN